LIVALVSHVACGHPPRVVSFTVEPPLVCAGRSVEVKWEVEGAAKLETRQGSGDWVGETVASKGSKTLPVTVTTSFKVTALDANPAKGPSFGEKQVEVPGNTSQQKRVMTTCDAAKCTGTMTLDTPQQAPGQTMQVVRISAPTTTQSGHTQPGTICVTHEGLSRTCFTAEHPIETAVPAGGTWTLETELTDPAQAIPPPALTVTFELGCH
jgi:hypothetical protein